MEQLQIRAEPSTTIDVQRVCFGVEENRDTGASQNKAWGLHSNFLLQTKPSKKVYPQKR